MYKYSETNLSKWQNKRLSGKELLSQIEEDRKKVHSTGIQYKMEEARIAIAIAMAYTIASIAISIISSNRIIKLLLQTLFPSGTKALVFCVVAVCWNNLLRPFSIPTHLTPNLTHPLLTIISKEHVPNRFLFWQYFILLTLLTFNHFVHNFRSIIFEYKNP